jgi:hypothetical protein
VNGIDWVSVVTWAVALLFCVVVFGFIAVLVSMAT